MNTVAVDTRLAVGAREAAAMLGVSERHLWSMTHRGEIPRVKCGRRTLYPVTLLQKWLEREAAAQAGGPR
jgi:excisionase family DNA binding protein